MNLFVCNFAATLDDSGFDFVRRCIETIEEKGL